MSDIDPEIDQQFMPLLKDGTIGHINLNLSFFFGLGCAGIDAITDQAPEIVQSGSDLDLIQRVYTTWLVNTSSPLWQNESTEFGCYETLCQRMFGSGNPDISGIGVIFAYGMEYGLAVLLSAMLLHVWRRSGQQQIGDHQYKTKALIEALNVFADTAIFFALAVIIATCPIQNDKYLKDSDVSTYDIIQSLLACTTTVAPCIVAIFALQCCGRKVGRKMTLLGVACAINIGAVAIPTIVRQWSHNDFQSTTTFVISEEHLKNTAAQTANSTWVAKLGPGEDFQGWTYGEYWYNECFGDFGQKPWVAKAFQAGILTALIGQIVLLGFVVLLGLSILKFHTARAFRGMKGAGSKDSKDSTPELKRRATDTTIERSLQKEDSHHVRWLEVLAFMFIPLAMSAMTGAALFVLRHLVRKNWGAKNDAEWSFGQMVAVLLFLPVPIEYVFYWLSHRTRSSQRSKSFQNPPGSHGSSLGGSGPTGPGDRPLNVFQYPDTMPQLTPQLTPQAFIYQNTKPLPAEPTTIHVQRMNSYDTSTSFGGTNYVQQITQRPMAPEPVVSPVQRMNSDDTISYAAQDYGQQVPPQFVQQVPLQMPNSPSVSRKPAPSTQSRLPYPS